MTGQQHVLPTLTSISPSSGDVKGGTKVTLSGAGFSAGATVFFGTAPGSAVTVVDGTTITVTVPAHAAGAVDIKVTTGGATLTLSGAYTYGAVSPIPSPAPGGPPSGIGKQGPADPLPAQRPSGSTTPGVSPVPLPPSR
ncbi:MAG TPA: IPT/TIG domain-containing protein [Thermomicrobiales bacterium]